MLVKEDLFGLGQEAIPAPVLPAIPALPAPIRALMPTVPGGLVSSVLPADLLGPDMGTVKAVVTGVCLLGAAVNTFSAVSLIRAIPREPKTLWRIPLYVGTVSSILSGLYLLATIPVVLLRESESMSRLTTAEAKTATTIV